MSTEATVAVYGVVKSVPESKAAPRNVELNVDYWEIVGHSPAGGAAKILNEVICVSNFFVQIFAMLVVKHSIWMLKIFNQSLSLK